MKQRFVQPGVTRLTLSEGDWIEAKNQLNVGEEREAMQAIVGVIDKEGNRIPNVKLVDVAEVQAYIVDWSFRDGQGLPVPVSLQAIQAMHPDSFREVQDALRTHVRQQEKEAADRKNAQTTPPVSAAIL